MVLEHVHECHEPWDIADAWLMSRHRDSQDGEDVHGRTALDLQNLVPTALFCFFKLASGLKKCQDNPRIVRGEKGLLENVLQMTGLAAAEVMKRRWSATLKLDPASQQWLGQFQGVLATRKSITH